MHDLFALLRGHGLSATTTFVLSHFARLSAPSLPTTRYPLLYLGISNVAPTLSALLAVFAVSFFRLFSLCLKLGVVSPLFAAGYGFDVGTAPAKHAADLSEAGLSGSQGSWMRVRGIHEPADEKPGDSRTVATERAALQALRDRGIHIAVHTHWSPTVRSQGVRMGGGHRLPLDLREVHERCRRLGAAYGDLVDVWEIENEPDIDFVADNPETYAAFQKAVYLGFKAASPLSTSNVQPSTSNIHKDELTGSTWLDHKRGWSGSDYSLPATHYCSLCRPKGTRHQAPAPLRFGATCSACDHLRLSAPSLLTTPRVIMAPLALPPGPYLERLWANGLASYTDGFNFHCYGYYEDFTGVYRQFEDAIRKLELEAGGFLSGTQKLRNSGADLPATSTSTKSLPVFITEYGYGLLDEDARNTVEGRVRQWRWFANVAKQIRTLKPEGPMAFLFNPHYEGDLNEFGLTMKTASNLLASKELASGQLPTTRYPLPATSLTFTPSDFGEKRVQPWMQRIGKKVGDTYASPALAYLWNYAEQHPYRARDWSVRAEPPSPVVIDFIADEGLSQAKSSGGYVLTGKVAVSHQGGVSLIGTSATRAGRGRVVAYNFSTTAIAGRLVVDRGDGRPTEEAVTLAPGERWERQVVLRVQAESYVGQNCRMTFVPDAADISAAVWVTRLLPARDALTSRTVENFEFTKSDTRKNRAALLSRALAVDEPALHAEGRWLVTEGVRVEERDGVWRLHVHALPAEPLRAAMAELVFPEGFAFKAGSLLSFERRKVPASERLEPTSTVQQPRAGMGGDIMGVYCRTQNGNLFQVGPRGRVGAEWAPFWVAADDFTMTFFGRAELPWRFAENRPAALLFALRPSKLPATFEVRNARVVRMERVDTKPPVNGP